MEGVGHVIGHGGDVVAASCHGVAEAWEVEGLDPVASCGNGVPGMAAAAQGMQAYDIGLF